jgi:hypothetical protein
MIWVITVLLEPGAQINAQPRVGRYGSAFVAAAAQFDQDLVEDLVARGVDVNAVLHVGLFGSALAATGSRKLESVEFDEAATPGGVLVGARGQRHSLVPLKSNLFHKSEGPYYLDS